MKIEFDYASVPTVRAFAKSDATIRGLMGPFGSGKSSGCVIELLRRAMAQAPGPDGIRRTRWAVIRNTYPQLRDTTIKTFHQWVPPKHFGDWRTADHEYRITRLPGAEVEILFRALDRPEHVANLLSLELTGAWINEAREVPWPIISPLLGRLNRYPAVRDGGATWSGLWMDTNPPDSDSWWYQLFEDHKKPGTSEEHEFDVALFKQPSGLADNAENLPNLDRDYYKRLNQIYDSHTARVYVHGEYGYVQDGKPVYPDYVDSVHCQPVSYVKQVTIARGWDFGLTPACVFTQLLPSGRWQIIDELVADDLGIDRFSDAVRDHCARQYPKATFDDYGDPAGESRSQTDERTCFEILRAKGIRILAGEQDLTSRIETVSKALRTLIGGKPQLLIDPKCKTLRKGFQGRYQYRRLQVSADRYTDKPDKNSYSHPHDALQYVGTRLFAHTLTSLPRKGPSPQPRIMVI